MAKVIAVGDTVRFTRAYLRSTGQVSGKDANGRWLVREILRGEFAVTNEPGIMGCYTPEEIAKEPHLRWRIINLGNLESVRR